jgi:hypothetical protein
MVATCTTKQVSVIFLNTKICWYERKKFTGYITFHESQDISQTNNIFIETVN